MFRLSKYYHGLGSQDKDRYLEKLSSVQVDPYLIMKNQWEDDVKLFPAVSYPDIVTYLLFTKSPFTAENLKAYKSLEAYNQFVSGWVRDLGVVKPPTDAESFRILSARVLHSQRLHDTPLHPWAIVETSGKILSVHCDCMAGLGEACTHVAAMLFAVEAKVRLSEKPTVTGEKAYWNKTCKGQVEYAPLSQIDFRSSKKRKIDMDEVEPTKVGTPEEDNREESRWAQTSLNVFFREISKSSSRPAILSLLNPYSDGYVPKSLSESLPRPLSLLYDVNTASMGQRELLNLCKTTEENLQLSEAEVVAVCMETKAQHKSTLWYSMREGRITASKLKSACHSNPDNPSVSLLQAICYPKVMGFSTPATRWGCNNEKMALEKYALKMRKDHIDLTTENVGLILHPAWPFLGASPDAVVSCNCCGDGCVEIKCPFSAKDMNIREAASTIQNFCLKSDVLGNLELAKDHAYFYQVQAQIHLSEKQYCDFVLWTKKDLYVERIRPNEEFWKTTTEKAKEFFIQGVLPEMIAKAFSTPKQAVSSSITGQSISCCSGPNDKNEETIWCSNPLCDSAKIFHLSCAKLKKRPAKPEKWICSHCRKLSTKKASHKSSK